MFISGLLPRVARIVPSSIALTQDGRAVTYSELLDKAGRLARAFRDRGVAAGDRIALLGDPGIDLIIAEHAAVALGAIPLGIYPVLALPEIQDIMRDAAPAVVVFDRALEDVAERLTYPVRPLELSCEPSHRRCRSLAQLIESSQPLESWHEAAPQDFALIVYTGGTSGRPKGVVHAHAAVSSWSGMDHPRGPGYASHQRSLLFNLAHLSGQSTLWQTLAAGGRLVCLPRYPADPDEIVATIEAEQVTSFGTVSGILSDIVSAPAIAQRDLRCVRIVTVGGAATNTRVLRRALDVFPSAMLLVSYSLTESGQLVSVLPANDAAKSKGPERLRSVGMPGRGVFGQRPFSMRIVDEAGRDVPPGSAGEILVAGPQVMAGYWNNPEATERALAGGWLHTGDIGRLDEDGYLYLLDRKRDIVIGRNGVNVYTSEVEDAIAQHPAVREVCVFGRPGLDAAEEIAATVVVHRGQSVTVPELREFCAGRIASFKLPSSVAVVESLPRTGAGKIDRVRLRARPS